jgi:hypothetical protein
MGIYPILGGTYDDSSNVGLLVHFCESPCELVMGLLKYRVYILEYNGICTDQPN